MLCNNINIRYTPEKDCKYYINQIKGCKLKSKHRHLNKCKKCLYGYHK